MAVTKRAHRTRYLLAVLVLAALTLVTVDQRTGQAGVLDRLRGYAQDFFTPLQQGTHDALRPIGDFLTGALDYGSLQAQNQRLRAEIESMQNAQAQAAAEEAAAEAVLRQENLPFVGSVPTVVAQVINQGSSNFATTLEIDKGTTSGVAAGQPVVSNGGLVGSVVFAAKSVATVELLTDPSFAVGVSLQGGNVGTAEGTGLGRPLRVNVDTTADPAGPPRMHRGQMLLTSGLATEKFPPGIPVGRIVSVSQAQGDVEPTFVVAPAVEVSSLGYVDVMLWSGP